MKISGNFENSGKLQKNIKNILRNIQKCKKDVGNRRFRGASPVYPTPRNREIGFVSSSFSFRACVRACERARRSCAWARGRGGSPLAGPSESEFRGRAAVLDPKVHVPLELLTENDPRNRGRFSFLTGFFSFF